MQQGLLPRRRAAICLLIIFSTTSLFGQVPDYSSACAFDREQADFETALNFYGSLDWPCTIEALELVMRRDLGDLDDRRQADCYFLLAAANYQFRSEAGQAIDAVRDTVVMLAAQGFRLRPDREGRFYGTVPQYLRWVEEGRDLAASGALDRNAPVHGVLWSVIGFAVTVTAIAVAASGSDSEVELGLPNFPPPPGGAK